MKTQIRFKYPSQSRYFLGLWPHVAFAVALISTLSNPHQTSAQERFENVDESRDFLSSDTQVQSPMYDLRSTIPGEPGVDYPIYNSVPNTNFDCTGRHEGYYADVETKCQAFRICTNTDRKGDGFAFLCPNGTLFSQRYFICDWYRNIDCSQSEQFYGKNLENHIGSRSEMLQAIRQMVDYPMRSIERFLKRFSTETNRSTPPRSELEQRSTITRHSPQITKDNDTDEISNFGKLSNFFDPKSVDVNFAETINAGLVGGTIGTLVTDDELIVPDYVREVARSQRDHNFSYKSHRHVNDITNRSPAKMEKRTENVRLAIISDDGYQKVPYHYEKPRQTPEDESMMDSTPSDGKDLSVTTSWPTVEEIFASISDPNSTESMDSKAKTVEHNADELEEAEYEAQRLLLAGLHLSSFNELIANESAPKSRETQLEAAAKNSKTTPETVFKSLPSSSTTTQKPTSHKDEKPRYQNRRQSTVNPESRRRTVIANPFPIYKRALPTTPKITSSTKPPKYSTTKRRLNRVVANLYRDALRAQWPSKNSTTTTEASSSSLPPSPPPSLPLPNGDAQDLSALASTYESTVHRPPRNTVPQKQKSTRNSQKKFSQLPRADKKSKPSPRSRYHFARLKVQSPVRNSTFTPSTSFAFKNSSFPSFSSHSTSPPKNVIFVDTDDASNSSFYYLPFEKLTQAILDDSVLPNFRNNNQEVPSTSISSGDLQYSKQKPPPQSTSFKKLFTSLTPTPPTLQYAQRQTLSTPSSFIATAIVPPRIVVATGHNSQIFSSNQKSQSPQHSSPSQYIPLEQFLRQKFGNIQPNPSIGFYQTDQQQNVDNFFLSDNDLGHRDFGPRPTQQIHFKSIQFRPELNAIRQSGSSSDPSNRFPNSINVPLPTTAIGIIPNAKFQVAQKRIDTVDGGSSQEEEEEEEQSADKARFEGPSSYEVPLASVGPTLKLL